MSLSVAALAAAAAMVAALEPSVGTLAANAAPCPAGYEPAGGRTVGTGDALTENLRSATRVENRDGLACIRINRPENARELMRLNGEMAARQSAPFGSVKPGAYEAALAQRAKLANAAIPGTGGTWEPVGDTPLIAHGEDFGNVNGEGLRNLAGRIQDFAWNADRDVVYVSVAQGGVYKSSDRGDTWVSISDSMPNLTVGSVAWSPFGGGVGTLVVITGDSNGGGNSVVGTGAYYSRDEGKTWKKSSGIPSGLLGFRVAVDPTNPAEFYAGTGGGLFRSTDAGVSFVNVELPTGDCAGKPAEHPCFFANHVTDVVVQSPDTKGNTGGRVVAAVGWRAGNKRDATGEQQAPGNGIYGSDSGDPGSFTRIDRPGSFGGQERIGRVEFGTTDGPDQNHDWLYAIVQDAVKFNGGVAVTDANEASAPVIGYNTALNGIYVSPDFGETWTLMQDGEDMAQSAAAAGSALGGTAQAIGYAPGVQAWYNEWVKPDPTRTDPATGATTRVLVGLEEVWQNESTLQPQVGPTRFKVIGRYFSGDTCFFLSLPALPYCPPYRGEPQGSTTTHPDQHGAIFLPGDDEGAVDLLVGNDGGVYRQSVKANEEFTNTKWGDGHNNGFHTLLPYSVAVAKDGVVWSGLQDNGHMRIEPDGTQYMTFGGDGTWAATEPDDSDVAYEATPGGVMRYTADGGKNWSGMDPALTGAAFVNQFMLDPKDPTHIVTAGREIVENSSAPSSAWDQVWDLGTVENPGVTPPATDTSVPNRMSTIAVDGAAIYVGWCGVCDVVTQPGDFKSGIATNVGGDEEPEQGTSNGWHFAAANGLPNRLVTSVAIDPANNKTIYVTMGGYGRRWVPPGANGDKAENVGQGNVFKSTDAGENFVNISGNLPDGPANWILVRGGQLIVGTDFGAYSSRTKDGGEWGLLGGLNDLPMAPVFHLAIRPGHPNEMYAATYGRGIYKYTFKGATVPAEPPVVVPPKQPPPPKAPRPLPSTGSGPLLPLLAAAVTASAVVGVRRRRAATR